MTQELSGACTEQHLENNLLVIYEIFYKLVNILKDYCEKRKKKSQYEKISTGAVWKLILAKWQGKEACF